MYAGTYGSKECFSEIIPIIMKIGLVVLQKCILSQIDCLRLKLLYQLFSYTTMYVYKEFTKKNVPHRLKKIIKKAGRRSMDSDVE